MERAEIERELDEFVEGDTWPEPDETGEPTPIVGIEIAAQVLRRLRRLTRERETVTAVANDEVARITAFLADRVAGIDREIAWGKRSLENYTRNMHKTTGRKSQKVANGTLKLTKPSERVQVIDEQHFLEWCGVIFPPPLVEGEVLAPIFTKLTHAEFVRLKPEPAKSELKKLTAGTFVAWDEATVTAPLFYGEGETVEMVPGVCVERDANDKFDVVLGAE